mgnify:FL=1
MENFRPTLLRRQALDALRGRWTPAAIAGLAMFVTVAVFSGIAQIPYVGFVGNLLNLFVGSFICMGGYFLFWDMLRGEDADMKKLGEPFGDYARYLIGIVLLVIYTFLWSLLLLVPGIIKSISYSMTYYIMRENPGMSGEQAIQRSMAMMRGHKMQYFLLFLSFIGWTILALIPAGLGFIWLIPYMYTAQAAFYEELKKDYEVREAALA